MSNKHKDAAQKIVWAHLLDLARDFLLQAEAHDDGPYATDPGDERPALRIHDAATNLLTEEIEDRLGIAKPHARNVALALLDGVNG